MDINQLIEEVFEYDNEITLDDEDIAKYPAIVYTRVYSNFPNLASSFLPPYPDERVPLSKDEMEKVDQAHNAILNHNYKIEADPDNEEYLDHELYSETDLPHYDREGNFRPSTEVLYNIKFIEELDQIDPKLVTKLLQFGFAPHMTQTKESIPLVKSLPGSYDIKGKLRYAFNR